ncbi:MAG: helix-hairpin-helix domain-containing protein [Micrococcales bacterium]
MDELRERLKSLIGAKLNTRLVVFTVVLAVGIIATLSALNAPKAYRVSASPVANPTVSIAAATIYVHVVGLVVHPGIYELDSGSRLFDAVFAAGGFSKNADQASVNLARELSDGEQVIISALGAGGFSMITTGQSPGLSTGLISLNRGSETELESLPRVGPALASRIIDWRTANGGFKNKRDLMKVAGIGPKLFAGIEKLVTL